jgi:hypothetical protein
VRGTLAVSRLPLWLPAAAVVSLVAAYGLASPAQGALLGLVGLVLAIVLALSLPPHLFAAGSLALLVTFQLSAERQTTVGGVALYTSDLLVVLVAARALAPRPRRPVDWPILDGPTAAALLVWALVLVAAAARGYLAGTPTKSLFRLDEQLFYYPILAWGFIRVLREEGVSAARVAKALAATALVFVAYMGFERLTHHRFENPNAAVGHLGSVVTAQGVTLHRDYGFYSAYDLYALAALAAIAYLLFARRTAAAVVVAAGVFVAASALTLVRGIIFGLIVGAALLAAQAFREHGPEGGFAQRFVPLAGLLAVAITLFWSLSPASAEGMVERFLPGVTAQSQAAVDTARYRQQALSFGYQTANASPAGKGLVSTDSSPQGLLEAGYLAHSGWTTMLVYTGWLGVVAFVVAVLLLVRRSFRVPDGPGWLRPFFLAAVALLLVEAFGSASIVGQPWVLGEAALVIGLRFGLADLDG